MKNKEPEDPGIDVKKVIKFTKKNWYWIGPLIREAGKFIDRVYKKWKLKRENRLLTKNKRDVRHEKH